MSSIRSDSSSIRSDGRRSSRQPGTSRGQQWLGDDSRKGAIDRPAIADSTVLTGLVVWLVLVTIGVAGRHFQPAWNVTPLAAIGLTAAAVFGRLSGWVGPLVTLGVPVAALAVSNMILPQSERSYGGFIMATVVFAATLWPAILGLVLPSIRSGRPIAWIGAALSHSIVFFLSTNSAYWWLFDDYPHSLSGFGTCFLMALPFFRWMPVGDVIWSLGLLGITSAIMGWRASSPLTSSPLRSLRP